MGDVVGLPGTDLEMGSTVWTYHLGNAVKQGLATEAAVSRALRRGLRNQFLAGRFDAGVWAELGASDINSTRHQQIRNEAGLQGMVLLKNSGGLLPLKKGSSIAVVGPYASEQHLTSDYAGGEGARGVAGHIPMKRASSLSTRQSPARMALEQRRRACGRGRTRMSQ
jgi:beta-glucosidase